MPKANPSTTRLCAEARTSKAPRASQLTQSGSFGLSTKGRDSSKTPPRYSPTPPRPPTPRLGGREVAGSRAKLTHQRTAYCGSAAADGKPVQLQPPATGLPKARVAATDRRDRRLGADCCQGTPVPGAARGCSRPRASPQKSSRLTPGWQAGVLAAVPRTPRPRRCQRRRHHLHPRSSAQQPPT